MAKRLLTYENEKKILQKLLLDVNHFYLRIPRDTVDSYNIKRQIRLGVLKFLIFYFTLIAIPMLGVMGSFYFCMHNGRATSEILMLTLYFIELIFPFCSIFLWANQSHNLIKLTKSLPKIGREEPEDLIKMYMLTKLRRKFMSYLLIISFASLLLVFIYFTNIRSTGVTNSSDVGYVSGILMPLGFPFEINYFPVKQLILSSFYLAIVVLTPIYLAILLFLFVFAGWIKCRLQHLIRIMKTISLSEKQDIELVRRNLNDIMEYHTEIARAFEAMNDICGVIILPNLFIQAPLLALLLTILSEEFNVMVLMQFVWDMVSCTYIMQVVQGVPDSGEELYEAAYDMDWYEMDYRLRTTFLIFFMKIQKPLIPTTIFANLDKVLYMAVMKCTYSYFMYLKNSK